MAALLSDRAPPQVSIRERSIVGRVQIRNVRLEKVAAPGFEPGASRPELDGDTSGGFAYGFGIDGVRQVGRTRPSVAT